MTRTCSCPVSCSRERARAIREDGRRPRVVRPALTALAIGFLAFLACVAVATAVGDDPDDTPAIANTK